MVLAAAPELPPGDRWLAPQERAALRRLRAPRRRRDFRLGRLAARRVLDIVCGPEEVEAERRMEVRPGPGGAPLAFCEGAPLAVTLSISHSDGWASACAEPGHARLGCDLERVEARSQAFVEDYLTPREQAFVAAGPESERPLRATLVWSAKEAVMKALGEGLRLPPQAVEALPALGPPSSAGWQAFSVLLPSDAVALRGSWRPVGGLVLTVAGGGGEPRLVESRPRRIA